MSTGVIGSEIAGYKITRRIGAGGMGAVYEGHHPLIGKRVAIKVLLPHLAENQEVLQRFIDEARSVNEIRHRGIVDIFQFGQLDDQTPFMVMEHLEGCSFAQLLAERGSLTQFECVGYLDELMDALAAAHESGVIHRDLKPSNIFLVRPRRGTPYLKLLDFGIAKLADNTRVTRSGMMGTPAYMAPEQIRSGEKATPRVDLYAAGVVLFELLTGQPPFNSENMAQLLSAQLNERPPLLSTLLPGADAGLEQLVSDLLEKEPAQRPASADAVRERLVAIRERLAKATTAPRPLAPAKRDTPSLDDSMALGPTLQRRPTATPVPSKGDQRATGKQSEAPSEPASPRAGSARPEASALRTEPQQTEPQRFSTAAPPPTAAEGDELGPQTRALAKSLRAGNRTPLIVVLVVGAVGLLVLGRWLGKAMVGPPVAPTPLVVQAPPDTTIEPKPLAPAPPTPAPVPATHQAPVPPPSAPIVTKPTPKVPKSSAPSAEALRARLERLAKQLAAVEREHGDTDPLMRRLVTEARESLKAAKSPGDRLSLAEELDEIDRQLARRR